MPQPDRALPPELLAPAGNWDCARAAVAAGANAIYFGLPKFNARLRAENFIEADLPELMEYLHRYGLRGYVTMNTLVFTSELAAAEAQLRTIAAAGVDAIIIQDLGLARLAAAVAPNVAIHASTQMTISSAEGLAMVEAIVPLARAILARELSIKEIQRLAASSLHSTTPLEVFVHGALCVAYSGQCLTSEALGQRSANRGECAQACRMPYEIVVDGHTRDLGEVRYLLSPQDLAAVDLIPDLLRAGVRSFKIEGRLKSAEYVAAVTRVYRKAIDACSAESNIPAAPSPITADDRYALEMTFSRGLSTGWFAGENHPYLTHGRFGKKRGPLLGTITACGPGWIKLGATSGVPIAPGDGVVFDAGENRDLEQGARIWKIEDDILVFHRTYSGINFERIQPGHTLYKTSDPKLESDIRRFWQNARPSEKKFPLHLSVTGSAGTPLTLAAASHEDGSVRQLASVTSAVALEPAAKHSLTTETLTAQLRRLGDSSYELASLDNQLADSCHIALSALNQLRRELVAKLAAAERSEWSAGLRRRVSPIESPLSALAPSLSPTLAPPLPAQLAVLCRSLEHVTAALANNVTVLYCDFEDPRRYPDAVALCRSHIAPPAALIFLATPRILKPGELGYLKLIEHAAPDGLLLRNLGALHYYKDRSDLIKIGDFSLNVANPITAKLLKETAGLDHLTLSYDLNISQVLDLLKAAPPAWFELTLHQHMPMFHMQHCVFCAFLSSGTTYKDCGRPCEKHVVHLRDRVGLLHRLQADVGCRNTLFNGKAQTGARYYEPLRAAGLTRFRIELLDETADQAASTIRAYQNLLGGSLVAATLLEQVQALEKLGVTEGSLAQL
ncbi:MAG: U32 family peptidase [Verrucomicrobia bacterium]|nr:MAG: U32 family peptidase [Verrucomicrobiota bacterium]